MNDHDDDLLEALRHHWGGAYMIYHRGLDHWLALRRDDFTVMRAPTPERLNGMMRADYCARPVPRDV